MAYQQQPPRTPRHGPSRERNVHTGSHPATYSTPEPQTRYRTSVNSPNASRHRESREVSRSYRRDDYYEDSESDEEPHRHPPNQYGQHTPRPDSLSRHEVHRSWQSVNPQVSRVLQDPALREAIDMFEGRASRRNRSFSRPSHPTPTNRNRSPDQYQNNSRPLGFSNLRALDERRSPQRPIERRSREDQRNGPYDAVQSVSQRSDYDYDSRGRHASSGPRGGYQRRYEDEEELNWNENGRNGNHQR